MCDKGNVRGEQTYLSVSRVIATLFSECSGGTSARGKRALIKRSECDKREPRNFPFLLAAPLSKLESRATRSGAAYSTYCSLARFSPASFTWRYVITSLCLTRRLDDCHFSPRWSRLNNAASVLTAHQASTYYRPLNKLNKLDILLPSVYNHRWCSKNNLLRNNFLVILQ